MSRPTIGVVADAILAILNDQEIEDLDGTERWHVETAERDIEDGRIALFAFDDDDVRHDFVMKVSLER